MLQVMKIDAYIHNILPLHYINWEFFTCRIQGRMDDGTASIIAPEVDDYKWYNIKKEQLEQEVSYEPLLFQN